MKVLTILNICTTWIKEIIRGGSRSWGRGSTKIRVCGAAQNVWWCPQIDKPCLLIATIACFELLSGSKMLLFDEVSNFWASLVRFYEKRYYKTLKFSKTNRSIVLDEKFTAEGGGGKGGWPSVLPPGSATDYTTTTLYYPNFLVVSKIWPCMTITVPLQKRAHYGISDHPPLWAQIPATRICAHV